MARITLLLLFGLASFEAQACIMPPPPLKLIGESTSDYAERTRTFANAELDEDLRNGQTRMFDRAIRVSLARILTSERTDRVLYGSGGYARRITAERIGLFKGEVAADRSIIIEDEDANTCGSYNGSATSALAGAYVVIFEMAENKGNTGLQLRDLRERRIIRHFTQVAQESGITQRP